MEKYDTREATSDNTIQCMHFACWLTKATDRHSEYVVVVVVMVVVVVAEEEKNEWFCCGRISLLF